MASNDSKDKNLRQDYFLWRCYLHSALKNVEDAEKTEEQDEKMASAWGAILLYSSSYDPSAKKESGRNILSFDEVIASYKKWNSAADASEIDQECKRMTESHDWAMKLRNNMIAHTKSKGVAVAVWFNVVDDPTTPENIQAGGSYEELNNYALQNLRTVIMVSNAHVYHVLYPTVNLEWPRYKLQDNPPEYSGIPEPNPVEKPLEQFDSANENVAAVARKEYAAHHIQIIDTFLRLFKRLPALPKDIKQETTNGDYSLPHRLHFTTESVIVLSYMGLFDQNGRARLEESILDNSQKALHSTLKGLRNQCYAHSGLAVKVGLEEHTDGKVTINIDTTARYSFTEQLDAFIESVDKIRKYVVAELEQKKRDLAKAHSQKPIKTTCFRNGEEMRDNTWQPK